MCVLIKKVIREKVYMGSPEHRHELVVGVSQECVSLLCCVRGKANELAVWQSR